MEAVSEPTNIQSAMTKSSLICRLLGVLAGQGQFSLQGPLLAQDALERGQSLTIHGWIGGVNGGLLRNLGVGVAGAEELSPSRPAASKNTMRCKRRQVMDSNRLTAIRDLTRTFFDKRDWDQFHTPKNLACAMYMEAAELRPEKLTKVRHEPADTLVYLVRLADKLASTLPLPWKKKWSSTAPSTRPIRYAATRARLTGSARG